MSQQIVIPAFEGHPVAGAVVKLSGAMPESELTGQVLGVDDVVQMFAQFRCIAVRHKVDEKTGELIREHVLRPVDLVLAPADPSDPDSAIVRALPRVVRSTTTEE